MAYSYHLTTRKMDGSEFLPRENTAVYWLGSAGFLINARGTTIVVDPVLKTKPDDPMISENGARLRLEYPIDADEMPKVDEVFYTHSDSDHMGRATLRSLAQKGVNFWGPYPVCYQMYKNDVNKDQANVIRYGETVNFPNATVEAIMADHPWQLENPIKNPIPFRIGDCLGYIVTTPDVRILLPGDSRLMEHHLKIQGIDLLALDVCISTYHMGPDGTVTLANILKDAKLIPMHYGTYNEPTITGHVDDFPGIAARIDRWEERARVLSPGEKIVFENGKEIRLQA